MCFYVGLCWNVVNQYLLSYLSSRLRRGAVNKLSLYAIIINNKSASIDLPARTCHWLKLFVLTTRVLFYGPGKLALMKMCTEVNQEK